MAHQQQLEKTKYRQWAKAGLGLRYLKEGLAPFCQDIANQQYKDILANIQLSKSLPLPVTCGTCHLRTLKPDHVKAANNVCPYGQANCNCWFPNNKNPCPRNICGAIYDDIIQSHASRPPAPNWKNTDSQMWTADPWSIAKCFINAPGYDQKTCAADTDCSGLLHVIINNKCFHNHIACNLTGPSIFSKVRHYRNEIFHSSSMELEETEANSYIDDMILILQDSKELINKAYSQQALQKLQALKAKDFIITTLGMEEILGQIKEEMEKVLKSTENLATREEYEDLKTKLSDENDKSEEEHMNLKKKLTELETLMSKERDRKVEIEKEHAELKKKFMELDTLISKEKAEKLEIEKEHAELKRTLKKDEKEYLELKKNFNKLKALVSEQKEEMEKIKGDTSQQKQAEYEQAKSEWRSKIIQEYHNNVLKVPAMPLLPDETCEFSQIYVRPKIVIEEKIEKGNTKETEIKSMSEIFTKNGFPLKSIYVVGDAGTGKSSFCKYLTNCWCMAHSEGQVVEDEFDGVNEMKKFEFLFFISLRHNQNIDSIHEMVKNQYDIDILGTLLKNEAAKMIILLDGLDEWSFKGKTYSQFQTIGLPKHDDYKDYTVVTTSRPWKTDTLRIRDTEIQQMLKLKGFDYKRESEMIERTVFNINSIKDECKDINECRMKIEEESLRSLKQVPIMLQQLICLWFDGHLDVTSRCDVNTEMLELLFTWNDDKSVGTNSRNIERSQNMELPECFADKEMCELNSHLIHDMSQLAYETLFNCPKDKSLTFDISVFRRLKISDEISKSCLNHGILTNDRCPSLCVSKRPKSMFSFIHKSMQEFLAAVSIAINFKTKIIPSGRLGEEDLEEMDTQFVKGIFLNCSTINEILEHSNVIIMLCGLEPRLATRVSRYIYDIVKGDPFVQKNRKTIDIYSDDSCKGYIQDLMLESMNECNKCLAEKCPTFYVGDFIISLRSYCYIVVSCIVKKLIIPDTFHSIDEILKNVKKFAKLKYLEKFEIIYDELETSSTEEDEHLTELLIDDMNNFVADTIKKNVSTLKSLSLGKSPLNNDYIDKLNSLCTKIVCILPSMINLVAIKITDITMSHDFTTRLCEFLEGTSQLEQIHINLQCECGEQHDIDLSKHQQLQYLYLSDGLCVTDIDTINLVELRWFVKSTNYRKIFDSIEKCHKLEDLTIFLQCNNKSQLFHCSITERLVLVLPLLHRLSQLVLYELKLTENIIKVPGEMKSLKFIHLGNVMMTLRTWREFVDSLPSIPQYTAEVVLNGYYITEDIEEFNDDRFSLILGGGEKGLEARRYIKDQRHLFRVGDDGLGHFDFSIERY